MIEAQVDEAFQAQQGRLQDMRRAIDFLAVSAAKYEAEVMDFFAREERGERFAPLARAGG